MMGNVLEEAVKLRAKGEPFVLATVVAYRRPQSAKPGSRAIIRPDGSITGWVGGGCVQPIVLREAKKALEEGKPSLIIISPDSVNKDWQGVQEYLMACQGGGSLQIYLEPVLPKPELLILGHSPVAQALSHLGKMLDFNVCIADPSAANAAFPDADTLLTNFDEAKNRIQSRSYVIVATMGDGDEDALSAVVGNNAVYVGFVASREKSKSIFQYLREKGIAEDHLKQVKCPAGLELGAETLPEIAFSIMAEILQFRKQKTVRKEEPGAKVPVVQTQAEAVDPICGMKVDVATAKHTATYEAKQYYFCCRRCKETFETTPAQYAK